MADKIEIWLDLVLSVIQKMKGCLNQDLVSIFMEVEEKWTVQKWGGGGAAERAE